MRAIWALRSALYVLFLAVTVVPWALAVLLLSVFVRGAPVYWPCAGWLRVAVYGARFICGVRCRVQGMENVPTAADATSAVLLASKHQSTWETFAYPALMPHPLAYVFKRELLYIPFFGWAMGAHGHDPHRPIQARRGLEQGRRAGPPAVRPGHLGHHVPRGHALRRAAARAPTRTALRGWP